MSVLALELIRENIAKHQRGESATVLNLGNCGMTEVPAEIGECVWLEELICNKTQISDLSPLANLTDLQMINCSSTQVSDLSPLANLTALRAIDCNKTQVSDLSPLAKLIALQTIDCSETQISDLSPLAKLIALQTIDCSETQISDLSPLANLTALQTIDCNNTQVSDLSPLANLTDLQTISCYYTQVSDLSPLANLTDLQTISCYYTQVSDLSPLANLTALQAINCDGTQVSDLSPLANLTDLQRIDCDYTQVYDLSPLANLRALQTIYCNSNEVSDLSPLANLTALKMIDCSVTQVSDLSPLANLTDLQTIFCHNTQVSDLSPLANLTALQTIDCENTQVSDLSPLANLTDLQMIYCSHTQVSKILPLAKIGTLLNFSVRGCPIQDCPADIYESGDLTALRGYFSTAQEETKTSSDQVPLDTRFDVKLILLGNSAAGKTSLLHYLQTGEFLQKRKSTHGLEVHRWLPDPKRFPDLSDIAVSIWDFGGQEYYHGAYRLFMSANAMYLLLWDAETNCNGRRPTCLKDGEPAENLEHFEYRYWLDTVRHYGGQANNTPLFIVQNKIDEPALKQRLDQRLHDQYGIAESFHFSLKKGCDPQEARQSLLLRHFDTELTQALLQTMDKTPLPTDWLHIRQAILDLQEGKSSPFNPKEDGSVSLRDFEKSCAEVLKKPLTKETTGAVLAGVFQRGGVVVFFPHSDFIGERVFLKPALLAEKIYEVLKKEVLHLDGEFSPAEIFKNPKDPFKEVFLEVAQNLGLIFRHPNPSKKQDHYIAPQYLPERHPVEDLFKIAAYEAWKSAFWLKVPLFYYKKLLHGLVLHYVGDPDTEARHFWKHGIVFLKNGLRVLIKGLYPAEDEHEGILMIGVEPSSDSRSQELQKQVFERSLWLLNGQDRGPHQSSSLILAQGNKEPRKYSPKRAGQVRVISLGDMMKSQTEESFSYTDGDVMDRAYIPHWLEIAKEGKFYLNYSKLVEDAEKGEIRIKGRSKEGEQERLLIRDFDSFLPRQPRRAKRVFLSYSHRNTAWLSRLRTHLGGLRRSNEVETWTDQEIFPGDLWDKKIKDTMAESDVFILLLSADFIESNYIWNVELKTAFEAYKKEKKKIIPILLEPLDLGGLPGVIGEGDEKGLKIQDFEIIPKDQDGYLKAISLWANPEEALAQVARQIREAVTGQ